MAEDADGDSQDGSSSSPAMSPHRPRSPLCLFYFSHPFRVADPCEQAQDLRGRRKAALDAVLKKRQQTLTRRKRSALHRRVWRRYLREPFWDLKTCLFAHCGVGAVGTSTSSLDEVLSTIRRVWEPPRCLSSDRGKQNTKSASCIACSRDSCFRATGVSEELATLADMGISNKPRGRGRTNTGLLHRRYSVPETVMRKYSLTKQQSCSSDSGVATVPVETPDTISSDPTTQPGSSSDDPTAGTSSPDSSDHISEKMGNRTGKGDRSPVPYESTTNAAPARSTLDTVSEETIESVPGRASEETSGPLNSPKEDSKPDRTSTEVPSSTPWKYVSPQNNVRSDNSQVSVRGDMSHLQTAVGDNRLTSTPNEGVKQSSTNTTESTKLLSFVKDDLSSSQSPEPESTSDRPSSAINKEVRTTTESTEPQSSVKDNLSSSQTPGLECMDSRSSTLSNGKYQTPRNTTQYVVPQGVLRDEIYLTPTKENEPCSSTPQPTSNREMIQSPNSKGNTEEKLSSPKSGRSTHSNHTGSRIPHPSKETVKPRISSRVDSSSSKTMEFASTESTSPTPEWSSGNRISTLEFSSQTSKVTPDGALIQSDRTQSSTPRRDTSCTPSDSCVNTPNPEQSQSLSSATDRASESCSITPMESSSSNERPSVAMQSLTSSASPPSTDHTISTQDTILSVKSNPTVLDRPASTITEQSTDHIDFMNDSTGDRKPVLNMLGKISTSQSAQSNSQPTGDSGHATEASSKLGELNAFTNENNSKICDKVKSPSESTQLARKQASTSTDFPYCRHQSKSWEIIIQPTAVQSNSARCPDDSGTKETIRSPMKEDAEFCRSKTCLVIRPNSSITGQAGARLFGTTVYPLHTTRFSPGVQPEASSHEAEDFTPVGSEASGHYGWSRLTDEERAVRLQLQRHRLWMNRKLSAANALPPSPIHGPISSCAGTGSTYRKSYEVQLVVPRYSALPRSVSMLVNTSSGECSSNSNSDSECISLVDSLEEKPSSSTSTHEPMNHDSKPVRGDIVELLPEERNHIYDSQRRINPATPRGKGKAFFVSMATGLDEAGTVKVEEDIDRQVVSQSMPDRLKKKLSQRHQQLSIKKKKISRLKNMNGQADTNTQQDENVWTDVETGGVISAQALAGMQCTDISQTENTTQEEAMGSIKPIQETFSAEMPPHIRSPSTATFNSMAQGNTGGGTFIVSRNEDQGPKEQKLLEQRIPVDISNVLSAGNMMKNEQALQEHSPPVKRFKVSKHKHPPHKDQETPKQIAVKILQNGATMYKERKNKEHRPLLKTSNRSKDCTTKQEERKSSEREAGANANYTRHQGKVQEAHKHGEECTVDISNEVTEDDEELKPTTYITSQETSTTPEEGNVMTIEQTSEVQRHPEKAINVFRRKMQKGRASPKASKTKNSPSHEADKSKLEDQSPPEETSLHKTSAQCEDKLGQAQRMVQNGKGTIKESLSTEATESVLTPTEELETEKTNCENLIKQNTTAQKSDNEGDVTNNVNKAETQLGEKAKTSLADQNMEQEHGRETDTAKDIKSKTAEKSPEKKSLNTVSCQTSPEIKCENEKNSSTLKTNPQSEKPESPPHPIRNLLRTQQSLKSSIPIMKSPTGTRKLSPDTVITFQQSLQKSQISAHTPPQLIHALPSRRSANLLGTRFHQRFEVIPEERSGSLESSTEDQSCLPPDRRPRPSLPAGQAGTKVSTGNSLGKRSNTVSHSCLGLNQATSNKYRQKRYSVSNSETSDSNHEDIIDGNVTATNGDITKKVIQRPSCPSRIPRADKMKRQSRIPDGSVCEGQEDRKDYQGKAALAPHTEDKDLLTLSKGWINFYLLKDDRGTPDSSCGEAPSDLSDKEKRLPQRKHPALPRTVTVVGGDSNRIRQYTVQSHLPPKKSDRNKEEPTILPELINNCSMRRTSVISVEKLPVTVLEPNSCTGDSDHGTAYLCLPNPHLNATNLLEGSGELACSELSVSSSSDSETDQATRVAMLPIRWPTRQFHRGPPHHWSRPRTKHYKPERIQSHYQNGGGGSAGWTVTVAGSNACPQQPPELEMHFSFPSCVRKPGASQSDSGLGEDNNGDKSKKQQQKGDDKTQRFLPPAYSAPQTHHWTLMVKNQGGSEKLHEISKSGKRTYQGLPDLRHNPGQSKNSKTVEKRPESCFPVTSITEEDEKKSKKFSVLWPKVKKIIQSKVIIRKSTGHISQEVKSISQFLENEDGGIVLRSGLTIKGSAITPEKKPRVPTMSERDLTRSQTAKL